MSFFEKNVSVFYSSKRALDSLKRMCLLMENYPFLFKPMRGNNIFIENNTLIPKIPFCSDRIPFFNKNGFYLFPTVKKTTLFYDEKTDLFIKIIHPIGFKNKMLSFFTNKIKSIYYLSENLLSKGIKVPKIFAYGILKKNKSFFYIMERVKGESLHSILIIKKEKRPFNVYLNILDKLAEFHKNGYWYGDLRLSHIFIENGEVSGFVDIDSIKKNVLLRLKNIAKDLAGLNHPDLPIMREEKKKLLDYYIHKLPIEDRGRFLKLLKNYSERRWSR